MNSVLSRSRKLEIKNSTKTESAAYLNEKKIEIRKGQDTENPSFKEK